MQEVAIRSFFHIDYFCGKAIVISADLTENEEERIRKLEELSILDTLEEQAYDDLTKLAAEICHTPIALVSLVDRNRQWFKSHHGLDARETAREHAFCSHAILGDDIFVVEDSSKDERFFDNPLVTGDPLVKFYAGAPLIMDNHLNVGTLCAIGHEARTITPEQKDALKALARQVVTQLELRLKIKELEILDKAKDKFIAMVSHELRTPLTAIFGSLSLLANGDPEALSDEQYQLIDISYRNTENLLNIVNDILDLAKLESGMLEIQLLPLNLIDLLKKSVQLNEPYCKQCDCEIIFNLSEDVAPLMALGDEQRLLQVLGNLVSNAAKFTHSGDTIELKLKADENNARIEVIDHGPGIPLEQHEMLFQRFKQLEPSVNNKLPGTGLGLNISSHIVTIHQGEIGFDSDADESTTFYFTLPLVHKQTAI